IVGVDPKLARIDHVERVLGVDEGADAAELLRLGHRVQRERGLAGRFRPVDFHDAAARQAANAEGDIEPERAGRDRLDVHGLVVFAETHNRALAELALDLAERGRQGFRLVHGRSFDDTQGRLTHVALLMAGIRPSDNASQKGCPPPPESADGTHCTLFVLSSQYVLFGGWRYCTSQTQAVLPWREPDWESGERGSAWDMAPNFYWVSVNHLIVELNVMIMVSGHNMDFMAAIGAARRDEAIAQPKAISAA